MVRIPTHSSNFHPFGVLNINGTLLLHTFLISFVGPATTHSRVSQSVIRVDFKLNWIKEDSAYIYRSSDRGAKHH